MNRAGHCWRCEAVCTQKCSRCRVAFYCSKECQIRDKWRHKPDCDAAALKMRCFACNNEQERMMTCTNCLKAHYCSTECQGEDWRRHKTLCEMTVDQTLVLVHKIKEVLQIKNSWNGLFATYYWGNVPAVDLLNLSMNEGEEYSNPLALLLCGVGDPRNVLLSIASLPEVYTQQVSFVLNDICPCTLARIVLLLYMLYKGGDNIFHAMIRIWYSVCISEEDFILLTSSLRDLGTTNELSSLTKGVMDISAEQMEQLKSVWTAWLCLSEREGPWVSNERKMVFSADRPEVQIGLPRYLDTIPKPHRNSAKKYFDTGIFPSTANPKELTRQNPTLTGRVLSPLSPECAEFHYSMTSDLHPFTGWDYKAIKKICYSDSLPEMYTMYVSQILQKSLETMNAGRVKFRFILCDALEIEAHLPAIITYDRITTSNLWDYLPLSVLLTKMKRFLNRPNPHAVLLTETINMPNILPEIVEKLPNSCSDLLHERAVKDTQDPEMVFSSGNSTIIEYLNLSDEFVMYLRASLLVSCTEKELAAFDRKKKIPSVKSLVRSLGLYLRDFIRNENTVFPFKWAVNCRRVNMMRGYIRTLEWKLISTLDKAAAK